MQQGITPPMHQENAVGNTNLSNNFFVAKEWKIEAVEN
jgi:hypothetical protein